MPTFCGAEVTRNNAVLSNSWTDFVNDIKGLVPQIAACGPFLRSSIVPNRPPTISGVSKPRPFACRRLIGRLVARGAAVLTSCTSDDPRFPVPGGDRTWGAKKGRIAAKLPAEMLKMG